MKHSSYYAQRPASTLERRDNGSGDDSSLLKLILAVVVITALLVATFLAVQLLLRKIKGRRFRARGQGTHLRAQSLRSHGTTEQIDVEKTIPPYNGHYSPASMHAWSMPSVPASVHGSRSRMFREDGFAPAPRNGAPTASAYFQGY